MIRTAIDRGITFMDNCWDYTDGKCEVWMGKALRDGYRQKVFLMTKFDGRTKAATAKQIDESLQRLQTDRIDLMQYHENIRMEDPDRFFPRAGRWKRCWKRRRPARSATSASPATRIRWCICACWRWRRQHNFHFDTAQMPLNILDAQFRSFAHDVVPKLVEQGIAVLGMKPMSAGALPQRGLATGVECLHYALTLPTSVVITGIDDQKTLDQAFEAARTFKPLTASAAFGAAGQDARGGAFGQIGDIQNDDKAGRDGPQSAVDGVAVLRLRLAWDRASPICRPRREFFQKYFSAAARLLVLK